MVFLTEPAGTSTTKVSSTDQPSSSTEPNKDVPIDESLFDVGDLPVDENEDVTVDESLFDIDNLQDLDLDDPDILLPASSS